MYFSLKDKGAQLRCVMFRLSNIRLSFQPENGMKVRALGGISLYEPNGQYQLNVIQLVPAGIGALQMAFEALKRKLTEEGLFDPAKKKQLPAFPSKIGIVTSQTGAAIRDIIKIIRRRFPAVNLILFPVKVQGEGAASEIAEAIEDLNLHGEVDVIIVGRGGGSLEDLWAFNEEIVARAIFHSSIPIISAVGHEIDFTISDFVADVRAATPSHAGEIVVRDRKELLVQIESLFERIQKNVIQRIENYALRIDSIIRSHAFLRPRDCIFQRMQRLDEIEKNIQNALNRYLETGTMKLNSLGERLHSCNPNAILKRGYSICKKSETGEIVRESGQISRSDLVELYLWKGSALCIIEKTEEIS
jgi:exodeoxyribonuclease VII large subunit